MHTVNNEAQIIKSNSYVDHGGTILQNGVQHE